MESDLWLPKNVILEFQRELKEPNAPYNKDFVLKKGERDAAYDKYSEKEADPKGKHGPKGVKLHECLRDDFVNLLIKGNASKTTFVTQLK